MKRIGFICAAVGFAVPIVWGTVAMITFGGPGGPLTNLFWNLVYVTCPPWLITKGPPSNSLATPFVNAALYAAIGGVAYVVWLLVANLRKTD